MKPPLLTVQDVLQILNISRRTVYYWIKKGILTPIQVGGVLRFHPADIDTLIEKSRQGGAARKRRILAIDDDILVRESLKTILERAGFDASVVSSGREALDLLSHEAFDLVITDIRMPEMNGIETLKAIREERSRYGKPKLPEIILTAYDDAWALEEAKRLGIKDFILKPFELQDFLSLIRKRSN